LLGCHLRRAIDVCESGAQRSIWAVQGPGSSPDRGADQREGVSAGRQHDPRRPPEMRRVAQDENAGGKRLPETTGDDVRQPVVTTKPEVTGSNPARRVVGPGRHAPGGLIEILPATIHIHAARSPRLEWMQSALRLMASEAAEFRPGGEAVITRLGDILMIQAIRAWMESDAAAQRDWLGARPDPKIGARSRTSIATPPETGPSPHWPTSW
jgi:Cupin